MNREDHGIGVAALGRRAPGERMEQIICPQCGAEATSDDFACPRCEALLNAAAVEEEPSSVVQALLSGNAPLRRPEPPTIPSGSPVSPIPQARPATRMVPRVKRGVDLALNPLSSFEAYLVSCIDGFLSVEEIASRAKLSAAELLLIFQGEALRDVIELRVESRPVGRVGEVVTQVEATPLGAGKADPKPPPPPPVLPPHPPLGVRITAPSTRELRSMSRPARGTPPTGELRPPPPPTARTPPPAPQPRVAPKSSAQLEGDEELFQARAALSADGRIVDEPAAKPSPVQRSGNRETVTDRAPPGLDAGEVDLPEAPDEPPLELAREVPRRAAGSAARRPAPAAARAQDSQVANESVLELASALESRGDVSGAIQILERAIASSNHPAPLYNRLALALVRRNDIARAVALLEKAVATDPKNKTYARNLGTVSQMRRR